MALDPATGQTRWTWRGLGPGYASPLAVTVQGVRQLITLTNGSIIGLNAATGALLWSVPFPDEWHENIASPVWTGRHVVVSGTRQGTHAYALSMANGAWTATQAWRAGAWTPTRRRSATKWGPAARGPSRCCSVTDYWCAKRLG